MTEKLYRRKPLVWNKDDANSYWCTTPVGPFYIDCLKCHWYLTAINGSIGDPSKTLDEAKARVEAEIDRRLASVLEVVDV